MIVASLVAGLAGILSFVYFLRQGQFEEAEDIKYQMFRETEQGE